MSVQLQCPGCGLKSKAADELAGKRVKCPSCGRAFLIPGASPAKLSTESETPIPAAVDAGSPDVAPSPLPRGPRTRAMYFLGGAICLVLLTTVVWWTTSRGALDLSGEHAIWSTDAPSTLRIRIPPGDANQRVVLVACCGNIEHVDRQDEFAMAVKSLTLSPGDVEALEFGLGLIKSNTNDPTGNSTISISGVNGTCQDGKYFAWAGKPVNHPTSNAYMGTAVYYLQDDVSSDGKVVIQLPSSGAFADDWDWSPYAVAGTFSSDGQVRDVWSFVKEGRYNQQQSAATGSSEEVNESPVLVAPPRSKGSSGEESAEDW
jgi:ribosomal protein S27E